MPIRMPIRLFESPTGSIGVLHLYCKDYIDEHNRFKYMTAEEWNLARISAPGHVRHGRSPILRVYVDAHTDTNELNPNGKTVLKTEWIGNVPDHLIRVSGEPYATMNRNYHNLKENRKGTSEANTNVWKRFFVIDDLAKWIVIDDVRVSSGGCGFAKFIVGTNVVPASKRKRGSEPIDVTSNLPIFVNDSVNEEAALPIGPPLTRVSSCSDDGRHLSAYRRHASRPIAREDLSPSSDDPPSSDTPSGVSASDHSDVVRDTYLSLPMPTVGNHLASIEARLLSVVKRIEHLEDLLDLSHPHLSLQSRILRVDAEAVSIGF